MTDWILALGRAAGVLAGLLPLSTVVLAIEERQLERDFGLLPLQVEPMEPVAVEWTGAPIEVLLTVGVERRLIFPQPFRLGLEPEAADRLDHEIYDSNVLLSAREPLESRARIQLAAGEVILLDLRALRGEQTPAAPLAIRLSPRTAESEEEAPGTLPPELLASPASSPGYIDLVRFAAQQLTAPPRLQRARPGLVAAPMDSTPLRLLRGVPVHTTPLAGWEQGGLHVTAVRVRNEWDRPLTLDPRQVVGRWRAAAFHHLHLPASGATLLYLVSDAPFADALRIWRPTDPEVP